MMKKLLVGMLILCMALFTAAMAEGPVLNLAGEGTEENPYLIATADDLAQLGKALNHKVNYYDYFQKHYKLMADIELNDCTGYDQWDVNPPANVWTPMGNFHSFKGVFDGDGHTISGLYINQAVYTDENRHEVAHFGLFGGNGGTIKNLNVINAFVHPKYVQGVTPPNAGILAGENSGLITGCTVKGIVICEGTEYGGIVAGDYGEITNCTFEGKLIERNGSSGGQIGGIAGSGNVIRNCTVRAQMTTEKNGELVGYANMGGIAGMFSSFRGEKCIENCTFEGEIVSGSSAGGMVGHVGSIGASEQAAHAVIRNCTNKGSITAAEDAGGIAGFILVNSAINELVIDGCTNQGAVQTLNKDVEAAGGIVGYIDARNAGPVTVANCVNEAALTAYMPGGIVGRIMQSQGTVRMEKCTNKGVITGEATYAAGILCHIQQWGNDWTIVLDQCVNEGEIITAGNAGGIVCFAFDANVEQNRSLTISGCTNRGNLRSSGGNNYMGGILGVNALAKTPVSIINCVNEGDLEYTKDVLVDAETLSGRLITLSRTSGGIVGYVGTAPYLSINSGERTQNNIGADDAWLKIVNCSSTGHFIHKQARFADDVTDEMLNFWKNSGVENPLDFFIALEGGIVGTAADNEAYSVQVTNCSYTNVEREMDDWNRFSATAKQ